VNKSTTGSVTQWIQKARGTDSEDAANQIFRLYFERLAGFARRKLNAVPPQRADHEQVALTAFASFFRVLKQDRYPNLADRDDLWQILADIVQKRAIDEARHHGRAMRDATKETSYEIAELPLPEPSPELAVQFADEREHLLRQLDDHDETGVHRQVAELKLKQYSNLEIAEETKISLRAVERKLRNIRRIWVDLDQQ
jgi:DNA-directed RNA polymerase specialized sigma24 family protein